MVQRQALVGVLLILAGAAISSSAAARSVEGFIEAESPTSLQGDLQAHVNDPTLLVKNPELHDRTSPIVLRVGELTVNRTWFEVQTARADTPIQPVTLELPSNESGSQTYTVENATVEITGIGGSADVLVHPVRSGPLVAGVSGTADQAEAGARLDGLQVIDGYRKMHPRNSNGTESRDGPPSFAYSYEIEKDLISLGSAPQIDLAGDAGAYIWDAHVLIRNRTETIASYQTGYRTTSGNQGTTQEEHYEYVTLEMSDLNATLSPDGLETSLLSGGLQIGLDGSAHLIDPTGSLSSDEGLYRSQSEGNATVEGNLSLTLTPAGEEHGVPRLSIGFGGTLSETDLRLVEDAPLLSTNEVIAASAGGATVLGLAALYVASAKGASLTLPLLGAARGREEAEEETAADEATIPEAPNELLFDPDRFTLYHLVRSRVGLSADECEELTGISDAQTQLDLLAEHDLLEVMAVSPRRYCVPGSVDQRMAERIAFLRRPEAKRLGELLAMHGLTPEDRLIDRARRTEGPLKPRRVRELVQEFVRVGLAYREPSDGAHVVDPTDELFTCFERMGEGAVPKVS